MIELESVTVYRGDTDRKGNPNKTPLGVVQAVFASSGMSASNGQFDRQESATSSPQVFVVKGANVKARDRLERANGERYAVIGHPMWDSPNELEVFGEVWVVFDVEALNG